MSRRRIFALLSVLVLATVPALVQAQDTAATRPSNPKKIIEYGWDVPFTSYVRDNIRAMEQLPFDGLIFKLHAGGQVMVQRPIPEEKFATDFAAAPEIKWDKFTDNFVMMWAASDQDWFNDEHWEAILHNTKLVTRVAKLSRSVGICFDHEPYGFNPWNYTITQHKDTKTFPEYEKMVRQRGSQFMRAVESEYPGLTVLTFFQLSYFSQLLIPMDPAKRQDQLSTMSYGLLPAFLNGMLEAASPGVKIIDGNESAYYYTDKHPYYEVFHRITQRAKLLIDPQLWSRYRNQMQVGQALYIDQYFGLRARKVPGHYLELEDQQKWFEHNVYYALTTTDEYVWCYSEKMNWWKDKDVPVGCADAIRSAKQKVAEGKPLGFDLAPIIQKATETQRAEIAKLLKIKKADIARATTAPPVIDGKLDDEFWKTATDLVPFGPLAETNKELTAETTAKVSYDDKALYIAVRCQEPDMKKIVAGGAKHDDTGIWMGDSVEFFFGVDGKTLPFTHFIVNPANVAWDALHTPDTDTSYNPTWQRTVAKGDKDWTVEAAFPWEALKMKAPPPGTVLRVNLCRQRRAGIYELSAWTPMAGGFLEHDLFGHWTFR